MLKHPRKESAALALKLGKAKALGDYCECLHRRILYCKSKKGKVTNNLHHGSTQSINIVAATKVSIRTTTSPWKKEEILHQQKTS